MPALTAAIFHNIITRLMQASKHFRSEDRIFISIIIPHVIATFYGLNRLL